MSQSSYRDEVKTIMVGALIKDLLNELCTEFPEYKKLYLTNEALLNIMRLKLTEKKLNGVQIRSPKLLELLNG